MKILPTYFTKDISGHYHEVSVEEIRAALEQPAVQSKGLFIDMIAQHEGLSEELKAMDAIPDGYELRCIKGLRELLKALEDSVCGGYCPPSVEDAFMNFKVKWDYTAPQPKQDSEPVQVSDSIVKEVAQWLETQMTDVPATGPMFANALRYAHKEQSIFKTPQPAPALPHDFYTHKSSWRTAIELAIQRAIDLGFHSDELYWKQFNEHMSERLHTLNSKLDSITSRTKPTAWAYDLLIMGNIVPWVSIDKPTGNYGNLRPLYEPDRTPPDPTKDEWVRKSARNNQLLYAFMLDCNAVGVQTAAENLVRSLKQNAKETL